MKTENSERKNGFFSSAAFKLMIIGILSLILLIPAGMIRRLIFEREQRRDETVMEVTTKWGNEQTLCGPVLNIPYVTRYFSKGKEISATRNLVHFLPEKLDINGNMIPEERRRGIYKVIAYQSNVILSGNFVPADFSEWKVADGDILWNEAYISFGISDMRGINKNPDILWNRIPLTAEPGVKDKDLFLSGISASVRVKPDENISFSIEIDINGSHSLNFIPIGKETNAVIHSPWNSPSFDGAFLPDTREVKDTGFIANWNIIQLNRNYPQKWEGDEFNLSESAFGTRLFQEVDTYQKTTRSVKYAFLFIMLTFIVFFFSEILNNKKVHPVYYLLVGAALVIFFSLLIALSEHLRFNLAYLIAAFSVISLITVFSYSIFKNKAITSIILLVLSALYIFLFTILQIADYSLLLGNIGLFIVLIMVMYFSRKVDWYETKKNIEI